MSRHLHIVCFDVPYPVSHGGYFDLYYKLKALKETGTSVHLHCYEYGRGRQPALDALCEKVSYYPRKKTSGISARLPFIVSSRINYDLIAVLSKDQHPVLLEGTHTTYILYKNIFPGRVILYRLHNIEHLYYRQLYRTEHNLLKKIFFLRESGALKKYETGIANRATQVLAVSEADANLYKELYPDARVSYLPLFLPYKSVHSRTGKGDYALYHGNLSVPENEKAALLLIKLFRDQKLALIIAGRNPSHRLIKEASKHKNVLLKKNLPDDEMEELVRAAQVNIIYSYNITGIKVKLLHALYCGRHCVVNEAALPGEDFRRLCHVASEINLVESVTRMMETPFVAEEISARERFLPDHFDPAKNAERINAFLP